MRNQKTTSQCEEQEVMTEANRVNLNKDQDQDMRCERDREAHNMQLYYSNSRLQKMAATTTWTRLQAQLYNN